MKSIFRLFVLLLLVLGWGLAALSLHVVRTPGTIPITLVTKDSFGITDTYVDTRNWTLDDAAAHPALVEKLIRTGKQDVLRHIAAEDRRGDIASQLSDALQRAPRQGSTQPATTAESAAALLGRLGF